MCDRLGGLERVAHHAPVEVALVANAKARGGFPRQRVGGNEVERRGIAAERVVFAFVGASHEHRQAPRDLLPRRRFMTVGSAGGADRIRHDAAACLRSALRLLRVPTARTHGVPMLPEGVVKVNREPQPKRWIAISRSPAHRAAPYPRSALRLLMCTSRESILYWVNWHFEVSTARSHLVVRTKSTSSY